MNAISEIGSKPHLRALVVDGEAAIREVCCTVAAEHGFECTEVPDADGAAAVIGCGLFDLIIADLHLLRAGGIELLRRARRAAPSMAVVVLTQYGKVHATFHAEQLEFCYFVEKPFEIEVLGAALASARSALLERRAGRPPGETSGSGLTGRTPLIEAIRRGAEQLAVHDFPILLLGESGTGKEVAARYIHEVSARRTGPFVVVDCAALPPSLMESELFGHERGAFTGAQEQRTGLVRTAHGGTLFLDEVGELPTEFQAKLLRLIQERTVRAVGSTRIHKVDFRVVAATNRNLLQDVAEGRFRADLYHRLNVFQFTLPPLRERKGDIPLLVSELVTRHGGRFANIKGVSADGWHRLDAHDWPGNVRELERVVIRSLVIEQGPFLNFEELSVAGSESSESAEQANFAQEGTLARLERRLILDTVARFPSDRRGAARQLGIGATTLYRKLKEYAKGNSTPEDHKALVGTLPLEAVGSAHTGDSTGCAGATQV